MSLGACYDATDDKIIGCKPGTLAYKHEEGHRHFNKSFMAIYQPLSGYVNICLLFFMLISSTILLLQLFAGAMLVLIFIDELGAWAYAFGFIKPRNQVVE